MSISIAARKQKGRKLQDFTRDILRDVFRDELEDDDIKSAIMGESGIDIKLTPAARKKIPIDYEVKNQEKFNINAAMQQAIANTGDGRIPAVVFSKNNDNVYISMKYIDFVKMVYPEWEPTVEIKGKNVVPLNETKT